MPARLCIGALALLSLVFHTAGLLAQAYSSQVGRAVRSESRIAAARYATVLAPFDASLKDRLAWTLYQGGDLIGAHQAMRQALQLQPASADLWLRWSVLQLGCQECYPALAEAARQVNRLAPQRLDIQQQQATLALQYWSYGDTATAQQWRQSLHTALDHASTDFVRSLQKPDISPAACAELLGEMPALNKVCDGQA